MRERDEVIKGVFVSVLKGAPRREAWPRRHEMDQGVKSRRRVKRRGIRREKACQGAPYRMAWRHF